MANFDTIKTAIDANIKANGTQDITGGKMNSILKQMVDATGEQLTELGSNFGLRSKIVLQQGVGWINNVTGKLETYYDYQYTKYQIAEVSQIIVKSLTIEGKSASGINFFSKDGSFLSHHLTTTESNTYENIIIDVPSEAEYCYVVSKDEPVIDFLYPSKYIWDNILIKGSLPNFVDATLLESGSGWVNNETGVLVTDPAYEFKYVKVSWDDNLLYVIRKVALTSSVVSVLNFYDDNNNFIGSHYNGGGATAKVYENIVIQAPENTSYFIAVGVDEIKVVCSNITQFLQEKLEKLESIIGFVGQKKNFSETFGGLVKEDGTITNSSYLYSSTYLVNEGEIYKAHLVHPFPSVGYSIVSFWNDDTFVKNELSSPTNEVIDYIFTIPKGVNKIIVSFLEKGDEFLYKATSVQEKLEDIESNISENVGHTINCLFIGNSVNQDHVAYLPWLLKNTYPELNFNIRICYIGGWTIKAYVEKVLTGEKSIEIFSTANNVANWTNKGGVSFDSIFDIDYDIISFMGYCNYIPSDSSFLGEDFSYFPRLVEYIRTKQSKPFKLAYLTHQIYDDSRQPIAETREIIKDGIKAAITSTPVNMLFPCGFATDLARNDFGETFLTPDKIHNNQGLPCIMGAYVLMGIISRYLGFKDRIINNPLRITEEIESSLQIPGKNGTLQIGTEEQNLAAQAYAVQAMNYGDYLFNNLSQYIVTGQ